MYKIIGNLCVNSTAIERKENQVKLYASLLYCPDVFTYFDQDDIATLTIRPGESQFLVTVMDTKEQFMLTVATIHEYVVNRATTPWIIEKLVISGTCEFSDSVLGDYSIAPVIKDIIRYENHLVFFMVDYDLTSESRINDIINMYQTITLGGVTYYLYDKEVFSVRYPFISSEYGTDITHPRYLILKFSPDKIRSKTRTENVDLIIKRYLEKETRL